MASHPRHHATTTLGVTRDAVCGSTLLRPMHSQFTVPGCSGGFLAVVTLYSTGGRGGSLALVTLYSTRGREGPLEAVAQAPFLIGGPLESELSLRYGAYPFA